MSSLLVLTDQEVKNLLPLREAIEALEEAFKQFARGEAVMPAKLYLDFPEHSGDLRFMPAALGKEFAGIKVVNSHASNPERGLPAVVGTYLLLSQETGMPLALMGATVLTAVRTGGASALASKYMARDGSRTVGLVGAGVQARYQFEAIAEVLDIVEVFVWAPDSDGARRDGFIAQMGADHPSVVFRTAASVEEAASADVVCTTTPSRSPIVSAAAVRPGTHVNAVGADGPGKQELDPQILRDSRVIVDDLYQATHGGELNVPVQNGDYDASQIAGSLADVVSGSVAGRTSDEQITVFDSTGLAIQDIAMAELVYRRALGSGAGSKIDL